LPTSASSDRAMIWVTAKLTEVNNRRTARPSRSKTSGWGGRADSAQVVAGLEMALSSRIRRGSVRSG
jgi:hypothetical protein